MTAPSPGSAGPRPHTQAGHSRPRQDPRARKRSQSQRGGHVGADGPGGCRRELGRPENRPPSLPAGFLGRSRQADQLGRRPAMRWMPGSV